MNNVSKTIMTKHLPNFSPSILVNSVLRLQGVKNVLHTYCAKRFFTCSSHLNSSDKYKLAGYIKQRIAAKGPMTVSEYMTAVLTHPDKGYYMKKDVFGKEGDFITSPEISQMFGELIAVWIIHEWSQLGSPVPFQIVEMGPGRGTLAEDLLRVLSQLKYIPQDSLSLHLVEVSPKMRQLQHSTLTSEHTASSQRNSENGGSLTEAVSKSGVPIHWYENLLHVPKAPSCFIAHEFFDALPVHKFHKTQNGWREVMVDDGDSDKFRFVLSPSPTPASTVLVKENETRDHVEVCPQAGIIIEELRDRISADGGMALIVDYGHSGDKEDTLRAFKGHKLHDVLIDPGSADMTADVDFSYLKHMAGTQVSTFGPVPQGLFLHLMGIQTRLQALMKNASEDQQKDLISGYQMLTDQKQMGERFKMFAMLPNQEKAYTPAGFPVPVS